MRERLIYLGQHLREGIGLALKWISKAWHWIEKPLKILGTIGTAIAAVKMILLTLPWF